MTLKTETVNLNDGTEFSETVKKIRNLMPDEITYDQLVTLCSIILLPYFEGRETEGDSFCINLAFNIRFAGKERH